MKISFIILNFQPYEEVLAHDSNWNTAANVSTSETSLMTLLEASPLSQFMSQSSFVSKDEETNEQTTDN